MADQNHSTPVTGYPATAYPYSTTANAAANGAYPPPPSTYYYNNGTAYYDDNRYAVQRASFIRRIFAILIASVIITGTIIFIVWLILRPQIPQFRADSLALSNFNLSDSSSLVTGTWDARFTVRNPNSKITLAYDEIQAVVMYKSASISETTVPPFSQGKKNETAIRATFAAASAYMDGRFAAGINSDRAQRGVVNFNVQLLARVRFKAGAWHARRRYLRVFCPDLPVSIARNSSVGSFSGVAKQCKVLLAL